MRKALGLVAMYARATWSTAVVHYRRAPSRVAWVALGAATFVTPAVALVGWSVDDRTAPFGDSAVGRPDEVQEGSPETVEAATPAEGDTHGPSLGLDDAADASGPGLPAASDDDGGLLPPDEQTVSDPDGTAPLPSAAPGTVTPSEATDPPPAPSSPTATTPPTTAPPTTAPPAHGEQAGLVSGVFDLVGGLL